MEIQPHSILETLSTQELNEKLHKLELAYYLSLDTKTRHNILLTIDELKIEIKKRK